MILHLRALNCILARFGFKLVLVRVVKLPAGAKLAVKRE